MYETSDSDFKKAIDICLASNFCRYPEDRAILKHANKLLTQLQVAYRATIPYLLEQKDPNSTWTMVTGAAPDFGAGGITGITQGGLFSMMKIASKENEKTNVRVNEIYLNLRVDYDSVAEKNGTVKASDFGKVYEQVLAKPEIDGSRVSVTDRDAIKDPKVDKLLSKM